MVVAGFNSAGRMVRGRCCLLLTHLDGCCRYGCLRSLSNRSQSSNPGGLNSAVSMGVNYRLVCEWENDVCVNAIVPGLIAMDLAQEIFSDEHSSNCLTEGVSLGRIGRVDAVASVARFLASDAVGYSTGAVIPVDGAWIHQF